MVYVVCIHSIYITRLIDRRVEWKIYSVLFARVVNGCRRRRRGLSLYTQIRHWRLDDSSDDCPKDAGKTLSEIKIFIFFKHF